MADLDVQRKKKSPLPWILLVLLIVALIAYLLWRNRDKIDNATDPVTNDTTVVIDTGSTVQ